jgi:hypothetical protein
VLQRSKSSRLKALSAARQKRYRVRRDLCIMVLPIEVSWRVLDLLVEVRAVSEATASSGDRKRIRQEWQDWLDRGGRALRP